jgi:hypothetical protein
MLQNNNDQHFHFTQVIHFRFILFDHELSLLDLGHCSICNFKHYHFYLISSLIRIISLLRLKSKPYRF